MLVTRTVGSPYFKGEGQLPHISKKPVEARVDFTTGVKNSQTDSFVAFGMSPPHSPTMLKRPRISFNDTKTDNSITRALSLIKTSTSSTLLARAKSTLSPGSPTSPKILPPLLKNLPCVNRSDDSFVPQHSDIPGVDKSMQTIRQELRKIDIAYVNHAKNQGALEFTQELKTNTGKREKDRQLVILNTDDFDWLSKFEPETPEGKADRELAMVKFLVPKKGEVLELGNFKKLRELELNTEQAKELQEPYVLQHLIQSNDFKEFLVFRPETLPGVKLQDSILVNLSNWIISQSHISHSQKYQALQKLRAKIAAKKAQKSLDKRIDWKGPKRHSVIHELAVPENAHELPMSAHANESPNSQVPPQTIPKPQENTQELLANVPKSSLIPEFASLDGRDPIRQELAGSNPAKELAPKNYDFQPVFDALINPNNAAKPPKSQATSVPPSNIPESQDNIYELPANAPDVKPELAALKRDDHKPSNPHVSSVSPQNTPEPQEATYNSQQKKGRNNSNKNKPNSDNVFRQHNPQILANPGNHAKAHEVSPRSCANPQGEKKVSRNKPLPPTPEQKSLFKEGL